MAAVSTYSNGRGGYSAHGTQNGGDSSWRFTTRVDAETAPTNPQRFTANGTSPQPKLQFDPLQHPRTPNRDIQHSTNGFQDQSKPAANIDPSYLSPYKQGVRPTFNGSRSGSEADSLIDLYGHPRSMLEGNVGNSFDRDRTTPPEDLYLDEEDPERSRWIHRDKLAIIESHEMQEAGIKLPQQHERPASKSKPRREPVQGQDVPVMPTQQVEMVPAIKREKRRTRSSIRQDEDGDETLVNEFDLRTPEEVATYNELNGNPSNSYRKQDLRKSSSRIPLPRSSPMPIPQEHIERDTPLPRKRGASGNWAGEENGISYNRIRSRGNSVGSQVLLDDPDPSYNTPTPASRPASGYSPSPARVVSAKTTPTHIRKPSITTGSPMTQQKPRRSSITVSPRTPSSTQRPKSRSGLEPRPPTAINRPEGEAPWLATMYKPDPRLPPDEQILPTHAKRLQQEQWERAQKESQQRRPDGKASPQLPREFSPLAAHTVNGLQPSSKDADSEKELQDRGSEWPLPVATPNQHSPLAPDEGQHAGYHPVPPRVKQGENPVAQIQSNQRVLDPFEKERLAAGADEEKAGPRDEDGKKEKGCCGCCIVM